MLTRIQRLTYLFDSLKRCWWPAVCPSCGSKNVDVIDRKFLVTTLNDCRECRLCFRHPTDSFEANANFYQSSYVEGDGITTFTPCDAELKSLLHEGFRSFPAKDATRIRELFEHLCPGRTDLKIIDFGCSWGYISHQLKQYGFDVQGFEISEPRASYGRKTLDLDILTSQVEVRSDNDLFFSSHVIEHVPNPSSMLAFAKTRTRKNGFVITICPNGSPEFRKSNPVGFTDMWGKVHPNYINRDFLSKFAKTSPFYIASTQDGWKRIAKWDRDSQVIDEDMTGDEILFVFKC